MEIKPQSLWPCLICNAPSPTRNSPVGKESGPLLTPPPDNLFPMQIKDPAQDQSEQICLFCGFTWQLSFCKHWVSATSLSPAHSSFSEEKHDFNAKRQIDKSEPVPNNPSSGKLYWTIINIYFYNLSTGGELTTLTSGVKNGFYQLDLINKLFFFFLRLRRELISSIT